MAGNGTTTKMRVLARPDAAQGDDWEEPTAPDAPNAVSNAALLRAIKRLEATVGDGLSRLGRWLVVACVTGIGAVVLLGLLIWWTRGGR